jgi:glycosyltransferase involved in cell wall biosynthesis
MIRPSKDLVISGDWFDFGGYSGMNKLIFAELLKRNHDIGIENFGTLMQIPVEQRRELHKHMSFGITGHQVAYQAKTRIISWIPVDDVDTSIADKTISLTMMETPEISPLMIVTLNLNYDEVWTPSKYYQQQFIADGLPIPCHYIPMPIDPLFHPDNIQQDLELNLVPLDDRSPAKPQGHIFLSIYRHSYRKGYDALLQAYLKEFKGSDNVSLVIFSRHAAMVDTPEHQDRVYTDHWAEFCAHADINDTPPVYLCTDPIPQELMASIYGMADTYVTCTRGEGVCLPVLEAGAMGIPSIIPNHTGLTDYADPSRAYVFEVPETECVHYDPGWQDWITAQYAGMSFPAYTPEVIAEVGRLMRHAKDNPTEAKEKAQAMQNYVRERHTPEACVDVIERLLKGQEEPAILGVWAG